MITSRIVLIGDKQTSRRLKRVEKQLRTIGHKNTKQVGRWSRDQLLLRMPKDTGDTARSVGIIKDTHSKGVDEVQVGLRYIPYGNPSRPSSWSQKGGSSNLFDFMMNSPMAVTGFYPYGNKHAGLVTFSKDVKRMRSVPLEAADKFRRRVIIDTKKVLK